MPRFQATGRAVRIGSRSGRTLVLAYVAMNPQRLDGPFAWTGRRFEATDRWRFELTQAEIDDLDRAVGTARTAGRSAHDVRREDFPLPVLAPKLTAIADELENGCGVVRVFGLPVERYDEATIGLLWMGLGRHLGTLRSQDPHGQILRRIVDEGPDRAARYGRMDDNGNTFLSSRARVASSGALRWHTDRADVVALLCVRPAMRGGVSRLASSVEVRNTIAQRHPALHDVLCRDIYRSRLGEETGGERLAYPLPVFGLRDGKFTSHYSRTYVEAAQLNPDVPKMSDTQWEALDMLADVCRELHTAHDFEPGEMQLLNNHVVYHARDPYEDAAEPNGKRLLYRLWICPPVNRALPRGHEVLWGNIEANSLRGGIRPSL